jgi:two-component system response regulator FixJ
MNHDCPRAQNDSRDGIAGACPAGVPLVDQPVAPWQIGRPTGGVRRSAGEGDGPSGGGSGRYHADRTSEDRSRDRGVHAGVVYLICDDPSLRASLLWLLASAGYDVETCSHSDAAFEGEESFDNACLLLDLRSSPAEGVALLDRLGRHATFPPVILMTGYDEPLAVIRGGVSGGCGQSRAFDLGLLEKVEGAIMAGRRARDRARALAGLKRRLAQLNAAERRLLDEILEEGDEVSRGSDVGGGAGATATRRSRLLRKLGLRSWSRLAHLILELQEAGRV